MQSIVQQRLEQYQGSNKTFRSVILANILKRLHAENGTQFVKLDPTTKKWHAVSDAHARATLAQSFRDALSHNYRSSKQAKQKRRHQIQSKTGSADQEISEIEGEGLPNLDLKKAQGGMSLMNAIRQTKNSGKSGKSTIIRGMSDFTLQSNIKNVIIVPPRIESSGGLKTNKDRSLNSALDEALAILDAENSTESAHLVDDSGKFIDLQAAFPSGEGTIDDPLLLKPINELPLADSQQEALPFW